MIKSYKTEGIVLKRFDFKESDKIITVFTKNHGKISVLAKGIKKLTSRKAPSLEIFNQDILFIIKGKSLDIVTETEVIHNFNEWRHDLLRVGVAYYYCELVDKLTPEAQPNSVVYSILVKALSELNSPNLSGLICNFEVRLLNALGFGVPAELCDIKGSLIDYIETVTERKINSPEIIRRIKISQTRN
jgi:DNA repair protein RecO (recombination protein O)